MANSSGTKVPPGQHPGPAFPRFGAMLKPIPEGSVERRLRITGDVEEPGEIGFGELQSLPRVEQVSDLHCVTTWTKQDLRWSGWRLSDLYNQIIVPSFQPDSEVRYLVLFGLDGYSCSLLLEDALAENVLIADVLDGEPLSPIHGAPFRVVSPSQYGYKNLKYLTGIALRRDAPSSRLSREHPRGRVALQERHASLPAWLVRLPYRMTIRPMSYAFHRGLASKHFLGLPNLLDEIMPDAEHHEFHDIWLDARPSEAYRALKTLTSGDIRLLGPLLALRGLPARLVGRGTRIEPGVSAIDDFVRSGFVQLAEEPDREIVLGVVGRFWKLTGNAPVAAVPDRDSFAAFDEPGNAKAVVSFLLRAEGRGTRLFTETRIQATDDAAARSFRRYWRLARPGSGLIRRSWLKAVRRRAER
jgi:DMSO/TMAO reductase YedYZ molybdopterin-dependent catalytic subunit